MESPFLRVHGLLRYTGLFLSGVCHQLPEHSLFVGGHQLPLCARCTGMYLGALWALLFFLWRGRSRSFWLPPLRIVAVLVLFFLFWAVDGTNSYVHYVTGSQILYAPSNWLRLASGMANGVTLSALLFPLFNFTLWQVPQQSQVIHDGTELAGLLLSLLALGWIIQLDFAALSSALVYLSLAGVLIMLAMVNAIIALLLLRRENSARNWRQALPCVAIGLVMTLAELGSIALVRYWFFASG